MRINTKGTHSEKVLFCLALFCLGITTGKAQYTNLINFTGDTGSYIGAYPYYGSLIISGDTIYGTTLYGGINGYGNIYSVQTNGTNYKDLVDFTSKNIGPNFGDEAYGSLAISGDTLYGMTWYGQNIYSVQTNGMNFKELVKFTGDTGSFIGNDPYGSLIVSGDTLYGMTSDGGIHGWGNIFSVQTNGTNYKDLIDFTGPRPSSYPEWTPYGSLIISGDTLYGMTSGIDGNIFSVQTNGTNYRDIIDFTGTTGTYPGDYPHGSLIISGDTLYGMTLNGGTTRNGNIFSVQTNGTNYKDLVEFTRDTGAYIGAEPRGSLTLVGNILYGMTADGRNEDGNIFSVQTNGTNYKDLIDFTGTNGSYNGKYPVGSLTLFGNTFYGTTTTGGVNGVGNLFKFTPLGATTNVLSNVTCNGGTNGSASVSASEGTPPYTYSWSPSGGSNSIASGLSAGTYTVTIMDSTGLNGSAVVTITQPSVLSVAGFTLGNIHCNGEDSGSASSSVSGGISPYTYLWSDSNNQTTAIASGLNANSYLITVTDNNGCSAIAWVTITQPAALTVSNANITNISCYGENDGIDSISVSGGTLPYTYLWSNGGTTAIVTGLSAETYSILVTDSNGCFNSITDSIMQPTILTIITNVTSNVSCYSGSNGSATVSVSGGTLPPIITTVAGNGTDGYNGDGIAATAAELYGPIAVGIDASGNIYIADDLNERIRQVNTSGIISTVAGNGVWGYNGDGGAATSAELSEPFGVGVDGSGNIYMADWGSVVQEVNTSGIINIVAGNGTQGYNGDGIAATSAELYQPVAVEVDHSGNSYIAEFGIDRIRKVNTSGIINTFAGNGTAGYFGDGGPATAAELGGPRGIAIDDSGNMYIADAWNNEIRKVNTSGIISTVAGDVWRGYNGDGIAATTAELNEPNGVALDASGNIYIDDTYNNRIRKVNTSGIITTVAGNGTFGFNGDGIVATSAELYQPMGIAVDGSGNIYIADGGNSRVRKVSTYINAYSYSWSPSGGTTSTASNLSAGTYTITVTNYSGCSATTSVTITQAAPLGINIASVTNALCNGSTGGIIAASATGGISPYTYVWNDTNSQTSLSATGLSSGTYTITATDNNGCTATASTIITEPLTIIPAITQYSGIKCNGDSDAVLFANASGGSGFYEYQWSNASSQTNSLATGLSVGTYSVTVTDNNGCTGTATAIITQPPALSIITDSINATNGNCNGSAWAIVNGGTNPYTYLWTGGLTTDTITNQCVNYYCCTIIDSHGCIDSACVNIEVSTGTSEEKGESEKVKVFPNPNNGTFILLLSNINQKCNIDIYDVLGENVYSQFTTHNSPFTIDLSSQPSGVYFYRVLTENRNLVGEGKIVIEK